MNPKEHYLVITPDGIKAHFTRAECAAFIKGFPKSQAAKMKILGPFPHQAKKRGERDARDKRLETNARWNERQRCIRLIRNALPQGAARDMLLHRIFDGRTR